MSGDIVCYIHSCNMNVVGTEKLDMIIGHLQKFDLFKMFKFIFINNVGIQLDETKYKSLGSNVIITNYSSDTSLYENCTLRQMYFFSQTNPNCKILYLHTKGIGYAKNTNRYHPVDCWNKFMLYCLVDNFSSCLKMLDYVDVVGSKYRPYPYNKEPSHFSGNFWWARSNYIKTNDVYDLKVKHDAEFWLFRNNPYFINILRYDKAHYDFKCDEKEYAPLINNNIQNILYNLENPDKIKILYGVEGSYIDVTDICKQKLCLDGIINIPTRDVIRDKYFGDPVYGVLKYVLIGNVKYPQTENVMIRLS
jgi:hypothetical protein